MVFGLEIRTVGDMGELPDSLPVFLLPDIPLNWETLAIIFPVSVTLAVVGLAGVVDDSDDCG
jgi:Sulfate permease and related transporters (MFS superfamily)